MKKISLILLMLIIFPKVIYAQETLNDIKSELSDLEKEYNEKEDELESEQLEYDQLYDQLMEVSEEKEKTENSKKEIENEIVAKKAEIKDIKENQIPPMEKKAQVSLKFSQVNNNRNVLLAIVHNSVQKTDSSVLEVIQATNKMFISINESLFDLLDLLEKVQTDEAQLEEQQQELKIKEEELKYQEDYLENLQEQLRVQIAEIEGDISEQQDAIAAQKEKERLYEESGCDANDVYGVDCAQDVIPQATGDFKRPLEHGVVTNEFNGWSAYSSTPHTGIDIANSAGTSIYPTVAGKVLYAGATGDGGGNSVIILHALNGKNYVSRYCHMSSINVSTGDTVSTSTVLGAVGNTGTAYGYHLHFEIQSGSTYVWSALENPRDYVNFPAIGVWW